MEGVSPDGGESPSNPLRQSIRLSPGYSENNSRQIAASADRVHQNAHVSPALLPTNRSAQQLS